MELHKSSKDFQLDKKTFVNLRWIAHSGQLFAIAIVKFGVVFPNNTNNIQIISAFWRAFFG